MKLEYVDVNEIKVDSPLIGKVCFKQNLSPIICLIFGIAIMFVKGILVKILGLFFILMALFVLKYVKDKPTIDVYQAGVIIYHPKDTKLGYYLSFNDIKQWKISKDSGHDSIIFDLEENQKVCVDTFQINKAYQLLMNVCSNKEEREIQKEKNKKMKWANPLDTLRKLGKKFTKK